MTSDAELPAGPVKKAGSKKFRRILASWSRWLHIYTSMFGLAVTLFFSATGITLNHPDWLGETEVSRSTDAKIEPDWVKYERPEAREGEDEASPGDDLAGVARLEIVEFIRAKYQVRGAIGPFTGDDRELMFTFKGPGYSADVVIDRKSGDCQINETSHGLVAVLNDLHKGRDTGPGWSLLIDISAGLLCFISFTGLVLIFFLKLRRNPGLTMAIG
ncbi:MAG: PepSY-associated TM helix domain-containing protein [Isosphaeraceae bacterium]